ncbi:MAG: thiamine-phosphate kinase [Paludibacteraceae bacterium]|nr:thiamine-phosphate kinase [Paludibacteraceae bacterium]
MAKTNISSLGEFGLIKHLTKDIRPKDHTTRYGIGDDAAVLEFKGYQTLVTSDLLLEGIHFNLEYVPLKHLGYKAAVVNFSDIYAMNGRPTQLIVSLGISKRFSVEDLEELYAGLRTACDLYGVDIVGGDTTSSMTGLTISITCIGEAKKEDVVYRNGAQVNDLICCTGNLGAAYMGLQLLERERAVFNSSPKVGHESPVDFYGCGLLRGLPDRAEEYDPKPAFEGKEYILERQLKPEARKDIIAALKEAGIRPTAMMDISDGLSSELLHICTQSGVGCAVYADKLPIDYQSVAMAEELNMDIVTCALNGGEDYELLFTISQKDYEKILPVEDVNIIGYIQRAELGCHLIGRNGEEITLKAQGFNAFEE